MTPSLLHLLLLMSMQPCEPISRMHSECVKLREIACRMRCCYSFRFVINVQTLVLRTRNILLFGISLHAAAAGASAAERTTNPADFERRCVIECEESSHCAIRFHRVNPMSRWIADAQGILDFVCAHWHTIRSIFTVNVITCASVWFYWRKFIDRIVFPFIAKRAKRSWSAQRQATGDTPVQHISMKSHTEAEMHTDVGELLAMARRQSKIHTLCHSYRRWHLDDRMEEVMRMWRNLSLAWPFWILSTRLSGCGWNFCKKVFSRSPLVWAHACTFFASPMVWFSTNDEVIWSFCAFAVYINIWSHKIVYRACAFYIFFFISLQPAAVCCAQSGLSNVNCWNRNWKLRLGKLQPTQTLKTHFFFVSFLVQQLLVVFVSSRIRIQLSWRFLVS